MKKGVEVERGAMSSAGIWNAKLEAEEPGVDVPENINKILKSYVSWNIWRDAKLKTETATDTNEVGPIGQNQIAE